MKKNNEVTKIESSSEQIRELTLDEVQMVAGGDASATHSPFQNAWGESQGMEYVFFVLSL